MPIQIQYRRGTAAQWTAANTLLSAGEPGYETDTGKFKVGDGSTLWNSLLYSSGIQGIQGLQGTTGIQGTQGIQGVQGTQGIQGNQGTQGRSYIGVTSTTSLLIGTGSKVFTVTNSGSFSLGQRVRAANTPTPSNYMEGQITAITNDSSITVNVDLVGGSGTFAAWTFSVIGNQGIQGVQGIQGIQGNQGTQGIQGNQGTQGIQGNQGTQGLQGFGFAQLQGTQGIQGLQGTTGIQGLQGPIQVNSILTGVMESIQYVAAATTATSTYQIQGTAGNTLFYATQSTAASSFTLNITNGSSTLNSILAVGQAMTVSFINATGNVTTSFPAAQIQIDGTTTGVAMKWVGGVAPTAGNANSFDVYTYTIIKTSATPTYIVLAQQTKWA